MLDTLITLIRFIQENSKSSSQGSKGMGHFSKQTASKEKATESKCRDVHDVRTPYTLRHEKISTRQSPLSRAWSEIGDDPWVMRIVHGVQNPVCEPANTGNLGLHTNYSHEWWVLNQSVKELLSNGAIPLSLGNYSCLFIATMATGEWKSIKYISNLNAFMYCRAALWKHFGQSSGPSRRASG